MELEQLVLIGILWCHIFVYQLVATSRSWIRSGWVMFILWVSLNKLSANAFSALISMVSWSSTLVNKDVTQTVEPLFYLSLENDVRMTSKQCVLLLLIFIVKCLSKFSLIRKKHCAKLKHAKINTIFCIKTIKILNVWNCNYPSLKISFRLVFD